MSLEILPHKYILVFIIIIEKIELYILYLLDIIHNTLHKIMNFRSVLKIFLQSLEDLQNEKKYKNTINTISKKT